MTTRRAWMVGAGVAAAVAGAGVAWWRLGLTTPLSDAEAAFWGAAFQDTQGQPVRMDGFQGRPLLVNFWATWCPPCVEELPLIDAFHREQSDRGWQVLGLAVDQAAPVVRFLARLPLGFPVALAGLAGADLSRSLGNPSGALPFSVAFGADGRIMHRKLGKLSVDELAQWARLA